MKKILFILAILFAFIDVKATHLMGGEITWKCIKSGPNIGFYVFEVKVYRDCQGIAINTSMNLDVHNVPGMTSIALNWISGTDISPTCDTINGPNNPFSCNSFNQGMSTTDPGAVEEHIYRSDPVRILGTPDANGWHFTWSSCCRNNAITNILNPGSFGFTLRAVMYPYTDSTGTIFPNNNDCYDSSPKFFEKPRTILEVGNGFDPSSPANGFTYSHNAFDEEQDSISYTWGEPLSDNIYDYLNPTSTSISFLAPYTPTSPINGIFMNAINGRTFYPANLQGNYVTCTNVSAYKCGQMVAEIFREIQIVLVPPICNLGDTTNGNIGADTLCNIRPEVLPPFFNPLTNALEWDTAVHCGDTVAFEFEANDYDYYPNGSQQDLKFEVSGGQFYDYNNNISCQNPPCATFEEIGTGATPPFITSGGTGTGYFEWITSCNHVINSCSGGPKPSVYTFVIKVQDDFCPAPAIENTSQVISITVYPPCGPNFKANEVITAESSCGALDGSILLSPSGGFGPFQFQLKDMNGNVISNNASTSGLSAGDYPILITDMSPGCQIMDTLTIPGPTSVSLSNTQTICYGDSIVIGINVYTTAGTYIDTLTTINGCDSTITTTLIVNMTSTSSDTIISCDSYTWAVDGITYTTSGTYTDVSITIAGCDSISILNLTIHTSASTTNNQIVCSGGSYTINGNTYTASGTYTDVFTSSTGCDSTIITNLTILNQVSTTNVTSSVSCYGSSDGSIDITTSGGIGSYNYLWSTGDTIEDILSLSAGIYWVQIIDSLGCFYSDTISVAEPAPLQLTFTFAGTSLAATASGGTPPYDYEIYGPGSFFASSLGNTGTSFTTNPLVSGIYTFLAIDANGCMDSTSLFVNLLSNFTPTVLVSLSNLVCNSLADLTIEVSQDSGEVDMSTALFVSNLGSFDIANMNNGDTIGTAYLMAGGGTTFLNTMILVSSIVNSNQVILSVCDTVLGCVGSFTINNLVGGGISILTSSVPDSNNYTSGNMSSITFNNCFINPCGTLTFTSTINSELGDIDIQTFSFLITSNINNYVENVKIFPNPTTDEIIIDFNRIQKEVKITVTDLLGKKIYIHSTYLNVKRKNVSFSNLPKGAYLVLLESFEKRYSEIVIYR
ncbi:T9SS type A sorting domain-containing protein [Flavobacteriales bacterium]|nr:T9SS type A sorting domain-containing protein [Flavobacteriales bacterium]